MARLLDGDPQGTIDGREDFLALYPDDAESYFLLTAAHTQLGNVDTAIGSMNAALVRGLPPQRFIAGPRHLFEPLRDQPEFVQLFDDFVTTPIHGPMLGAMTDHSVRVWLRTAEASTVEVIVSESPDLMSPVISQAVKTGTGGDFTALAELDGLSPDTHYHYGVRIDGQITQPNHAQFDTYPSSGSRGVVTVAFGGCSNYRPPNEPMWDVIRDQQPQAMLLLGDNVYIDYPQRPDIQRYAYYVRQSTAPFQRLVGSVPTYAIWEEHYFSDDDSFGGPGIDEPNWKRPNWERFRQNWNNPAYGGDGHPGVWHDFSLGDVDFFMLDTRYYREPPAAGPQSMLGPVQKQWLFDRLDASTATFKVIASSVPFASNTKPGSEDTWDGYPEEREEIFRFIETRHIGGVLLLASDRHRADIWKIDRPNGCDFYEFENGLLSFENNHPRLPGALLSFNDRPGFGLLEFNTRLSDPTVTYRVINIDNVTAYSFTLRLSQLSEPGSLTLFTLIIPLLVRRSRRCPRQHRHDVRVHARG